MLQDASGDPVTAVGIFPVISENAVRASLGILDRTVRRGYAQPATG
jgi:hypothetical protein